MNVTVKHPHLPGVSRTVASDDVPRWVAQGWIDPSAPSASESAKSQTRIRAATRRPKSKKGKAS